MLYRWNLFSCCTLCIAHGFRTEKPSDQRQTLDGLIAAVDRNCLPGDAQLEKALLARLTENRFDLTPLEEGEMAAPGDVITFSWN